MNEQELEQLRQQIEMKEMKRDLAVDRETLNDEKRTVELSVASEFPVERFFGFEVLDIDPASIRLARFKDGASVRDTHYGDQVAVVLRSWIDTTQKKLRVLVEFSKNTQRANELFNDIKDGIRRNVSIRYQIYKAQLDKEENDIRTYRITDWEPIHVSIEPDGADPSVGVGRSKDEPEETTIELMLDPKREIEDQIKEFNNKNKSIKLNYVQLNNERNASMNEQELQAKIDAALQNASDERSKEVKNIFALARNHSKQLAGLDLMAKATEYVEQGKTSRDFEQLILANLNNPEATRKPSDNLGMDEKDIEKFSIRNLILSYLPDQKASVGSYERSVSEEYRKKGRYCDRSIVSIPPDVLFGKKERVLTVGAPTAGGNLVADNFEAASFIELARNKTLGFQLGAQFISGLVGDVVIPIQLTAGSVEWLDEDTAPSASDLTIGQKTASPKNAASTTSFSRNLLLQSTPGIDLIVENDLRNIVRIAVDKALFEGTGANGQPYGIKTTTGVNDVTGTGMSWSTVVDFEKNIQIANLDVNTMAYCFNPTVGAGLKTEEKSSGTGIYLFEDGLVNGYKTGITNQISNGNMGFGDFSQAYVLQWGGVDLLFDPFYYSTQGRIRVTIFISIDVLLRYPKAFSWSDDVTFT